MTEEVNVPIRDTNVLTLEEARMEIKDINIAIKNGKILKIGQKLKYDSKDEINGQGEVFMPGLIYTHTHTFHILLRGRFPQKNSMSTRFG